jgi:hypothetical protein
MALLIYYFSAVIFAEPFVTLYPKSTVASIMSPQVAIFYLNHFVGFLSSFVNLFFSISFFSLT